MIMDRDDRTTKKERMYALLDRWQESGMRQEDFCREEGIGLPKFQYWRRKQKQEQEGGGAFIALSGEMPTEAPPMELIYPGGVRLRLPMSTPAKKVHELAGLS
jgi:hypothetical protein